jgi:peptidoglycan/LPS O-acetylase OafA/YrhL
MSQNAATFDLVSSESAQSVAEPEFRLGHRPELDGLRGISILMVLLLHFGFRFLPGGFLGVDIFFVLSGFLITSLLVSEQNRFGKISLKAFYIRRALRLTPALILYILVLAVCALIFMKRDRAFEIYQGILLTLSYVSNWIFAFNPRIKIGPLGITWSLAIEEQFYLVWPLLLSIAFRLKVPRRVVLYGLLLTIISVALHRKLLLESGALERRLYYATDTRADALLIGCLVALLLAWNLIPRNRLVQWWLSLTGALGFLFVAYLAVTSAMADVDLYLGLFTLVSLAIGAILIVLVLWPPAWALRMLRARPLTWIGRISYGVYLWHWPIREILCPNIQTAPIWRIVVTVAVSITVAALSFYFVETPFLRLKERFVRSKSEKMEVDQRELLTADCQTARLF